METTAREVKAVMADTFIDNYKSKHRHPLNKLCHTIGIPMITIAWPLFFFKWRWALALFIIGWTLQFIGHAIEGNQPAFFKNPIYFFIGPWWFARRVGEAVGLWKHSVQDSAAPRANAPVQNPER